MSSQYVIALEQGNAEKRDAISNYITKKGWAIWHWFDDLWLLAEVPESYTAYSLYTELVETNPILENESLLVFSMADQGNRTHWGRANKDSWIWMKEYWSKVE